jgi:hypothetical protein
LVAAPDVATLEAAKGRPEEGGEEEEVGRRRRRRWWWWWWWWWREEGERGREEGKRGREEGERGREREGGKRERPGKPSISHLHWVLIKRWHSHTPHTQTHYSPFQNPLHPHTIPLFQLLTHTLFLHTLFRILFIHTLYFFNSSSPTHYSNSSPSPSPQPP